MIKIENLCKSFNGVPLFQNFSLTVETGEFIIFSGPSGCGKTTLLNLIGAIEKPDAGAIWVDEMNVADKRNHLRFYRTKVGFLFQNFALVDNKTVKENLQLIRKDCKTGISITDALKFVGLEDKLNNKVYTLSGGEQQRVALARLMLKKCDVILADEPTGSLDRNNADVVMGLLRKFNEAGKTIILVTHDEEIKKQGGRVVNLCEV
ncbi:MULTISPECIES: ABC transporter ATP-binding protein [Paenibacillus]|uniref:ABC transporter ATP-binding protein n=1 Tax=Paenibacillus TaxID=44249 RepID=UPI00049202EE|nr:MULTISPECIES: ATP-binding cassette domain-containing protein [Paenibacillus]MEC2345501.1 ATP-binding cassette domain-containing protein [Paenibacillus barengoltzii]SMF24027.1 putative ABC transport system ATP-binding protein [Paenibacillus barengoltzii]